MVLLKGYHQWTAHYLSFPKIYELYIDVRYLTVAFKLEEWQKKCFKHFMAWFYGLSENWKEQILTSCFVLSV